MKIELGTKEKDMMKKIILLPIIALSIGGMFLTSCGDGEKVHLNYGTKITNALEDITSYGNLQTKINDGSNFLIVVYTKSGCSCWNTFEHMVLEPFNAENNTLIYKINYNLFFSGDEPLDTFGISISESNASIALFKDGKVKTQEMYQESNKMFKDKSYFEAWFEKNCVLPNMFYINKSQLDGLYASTTPFVIEFSRETCPDCRYVNSHGLKDFSTKISTSKPLYIFDVDEVRLDSSGNIQTDIWNTFKKEYGLSNELNFVYGYGTGYVPTFFYIEPNGTDKAGINVNKSAAVFVNDKIELVDGIYKVKTSFYSEARKPNLSYLSSASTPVLEGLVIPESDVTVYPEYGNYIAWNYSAAEVYHNPLLNLFLEQYLK